MKDDVREHREAYWHSSPAMPRLAGAKVFLARTAAEANAYIVSLGRQREVKLVVQEQELASEETHLNQALADAEIRVLENRSRRVDHPVADSAPATW